MKVSMVKTENYRRFTLRPSNAQQRPVGEKRVATLNVLRHWRTKPHPFFFVRNYGTMFTVQVMALDFHYYRRAK